MAVPSYTTDLTTVAIGDLIVDGGGSSWDESSDAAWDDAGSMVDDQNLYYNNTQCVSAQFTKDGVGTIIYAHGTGITIPTDGAILMWHMWAAPPALATKANGGVRILVGDSYGDFEGWIVSGSDYPPEFIWNNHAINPDIGSPDYTVGTPTIYSYFGTAVNALAQARGNPNAMNAIRYGRCTQIYTGGEAADYAIFSGYAAVDNIVTAKYGLLRNIAGGYLFQGLMSLGVTATAVDFRDANVNIIIADTENVTSGFNAIEIHNASSNVEWTAISIAALGTVSKGTFEMVANATVTLDTCVFTDMSTFLFLSNASIINCTFRRCAQITHGGAEFEACVFEGYEGTAGTGYLLYNIATNPDGELDNCAFTKGTAATHAIQFGTSTPQTITLTGIDFSGYNAVTQNTDSALYFPDTGSDVTWTVSLSGCTGDITAYKARTGDTVTLIADQVSHELVNLVNTSEVTYVKRGTAIDTGADGASTLGSRNLVTGNSWTVDAYKGHLLEITSGADAGRYYVTGNSTTTLYLDAALTATASALTWELYDENDDTAVYHVESVTGNTTSYTYTYSSDVLVDIIIIHVNYEQIVIPSVTLGNSSQSLPISQVPDVNYLNP